MNVTGDTTFSGAVGDTTPLSSLAITESSTVQLGGNVTTSGDQGYGGEVILTTATTLTGKAGTFSGGLNGSANDLVLNFSSTTALDSSFSNLLNLASVGDITLNGAIPMWPLMCCRSRM